MSFSDLATTVKVNEDVARSDEVLVPTRLSVVSW